jgi:putative transposase
LAALSFESEHQVGGTLNAQTLAAQLYTKSPRTHQIPHRAGDERRDHPSGGTDWNLYRPDLMLTPHGVVSKGPLELVWGWGPTMAALAIRDDIAPEELRHRARRESDGRISARLIAIANALEGMDRASAARLAGMEPSDLAGLGSPLQCGRNCQVVQSTSAGTPAEAERRTDGDPELVLTGSDPAVDKIARWRIVDLCRWVEQRWGVSYAETGMLRVLWSLDLSHRKTRPRHPQSSDKAQQAIKNGGSLPA